jgi:F0F1-type ATP synthase gamma subunit
MKGEIDALYIGYTRFINTMKQEPVFEQLLPLSGEPLAPPRPSGTMSTNRMPRRSSTIC